MTTQKPTVDITSARSPSSTRRVALASMAGTTMEFYDFAIYGLAAALVFGKVFFPNVSPMIGLLSSFATFGIGFVARPLGGIVFGHLGDRLGRKRVLVATLLIMGGATALIGCLPGYATIGIWAPILLVAIRLLQGLAYGGEWGGAVLMAYESVPEGRRGLYAAFPMAGISAGSVLGTVAFLLIGLLPQDQLESWGWRVPFWFGAVLFLVGYVIRRKIAESPEFRHNEGAARVPRSPLVEVLRTHPLQILLSIGVSTGVTVGAYVYLTFSVSYSATLGLTSTLVLVSILVSNLIQIVIMPVGGALADRFGYRPVFLTAVVLWAVATLGFFPALETGNPLLIVASYVIPYGFGCALALGTMAGMFAGSFDSRVGYSGISLGYQLSNLVAGFGPFVATLIAGAGGVVWVGVCVSVLLVASAACAHVLTRPSTTRSSVRPAT